MLTNKPEAKADLNGHPRPDGLENPNPAPDATAPAATGAVPKPAVASAQRRVASLPNRAPDNTWDVISKASIELLQERGYKRADDVQKALEQLRPVARLALTMHYLEGGSIALNSGDLEFNIKIVYGVANVTEDLSLPATVRALDALPQETICTLTLFLTTSLQDAAMERIVAEINAADALSVRLELIESEQAQDQSLANVACDHSNSQEDSHNGKD